jgi:hypothetical protein
MSISYRVWFESFCCLAWLLEFFNGVSDTCCRVVLLLSLFSVRRKSFYQTMFELRFLPLLLLNIGLGFLLNLSWYGFTESGVLSCTFEVKTLIVSFLVDVLFC